MQKNITLAKHPAVARVPKKMTTTMTMILTQLRRIAKRRKDDRRIMLVRGGLKGSSALKSFYNNNFPFKNQDKNP